MQSFSAWGGGGNVEQGSNCSGLLLGSTTGCHICLKLSYEFRVLRVRGGLEITKISNTNRSSMV